MMPLELWILLAVLAAAAIFGAVVRLRRRRLQKAGASSPEGSVYPLW
jgi:hypothetical protein